MDTLISPFLYRNIIIETLLRSYKYGKAHILTSTVSNLIIKYLEPAVLKSILQNIDGITYIPLHSKKERNRGFNQAQLLAKKLSKDFAIPFADKMFIRIINTKPQASLKKKARLKNMIDVFKINPHYDVNNLKILIIDDVSTTLSTLNNAAKILKDSGIKKVWGLTVARG